LETIAIASNLKQYALHSIIAFTGFSNGTIERNHFSDYTFAGIAACGVDVYGFGGFD